MRTAYVFYLLILVGLQASSLGAEALEIGPENVSELPKGKEADGIIGDFILRNDKVVALISGNLPFRRANMSTFYGGDGITPGCLYDLTFREQQNDQITIFSPCDQRGAVSYVRIVPDQSDGVVETIKTAANNKGVYLRHEYRVKEGWQGVLITTTIRNESNENRTQSLTNRWTSFSRTGVFQKYRWADAVDPADHAGYAYYSEGDRNPTLKPGEGIEVLTFLAVGRSPAEAVGIAAKQRAQIGEIVGEATDRQGNGVSTALLQIASGKEMVTAYVDKEGKFKFPFPMGEYQARILDLGREASREVIVRSDEGLDLKVALSERALIAFHITDESGRDIPCKAQFIGIDGSPSPDLGPANRAHGCKDQYHSETGKFSTPLPPGKYRVVVTHGIEFSHLVREIGLRDGETVLVKGELKRLVDTRGWVSADYHNHSTPSGDNTTGTDDRIINLAAEQIEFAPTTEHNRHYDWRPHIEKLGLTDELNTVSGIELTGSGPHLNSFPFHAHPHQQDGGAPQWNRDPRISAILLRDHQERIADRWIQINHPDLVENFIDRNGDGFADGGYLGLPSLIDAVEVQNFIDSTLLSLRPVRIVGKTVIQNREFLWLQLLNSGHRIVGMAVCDAHSVHGNGVGGWRMYMPSQSDKPQEIDWRENSRHAKAGRSILTTGPFLQVQTSEGALPGSDVRVSGEVTLKIKIQCTDWIDIDRVQILVNGRQSADLNYTRKSNPEMFQDGVIKFERDVRVPLSQDAHIIVVALHESMTLAVGYGTSSQASLRPFAFNNPIYVDVDGGGFKANGDTLGFPLGGKKYTLEEAKKLLEL
jgi:hypothetical protein